MRNAKAAGLLAAALVVAPAVASAQTAPTGAKRPYKPQPLILHKEQLGDVHFAAVARDRMRNGDCAGALDAFDAALRTANDPTLYRDRGLCNEKLGYPYPAIDDYRHYLTQVPDAADADGIREHLGKLLAQTGQGGPDEGDDDSSPGGAGAGTGAGASAKVSIGGSGVEASTSADSGGGRPHDRLDYVERDNDEMASSLRRGKGWGLAPFFAEHKFLPSGSSFDTPETWSESIGLQFRYSVGPQGTIVVEAGYEHFNASDVALASTSGLTSQVGWEFRLPIDAEYDNQLLVTPGLGYEHLVVTGNGQSLSLPFDVLMPRARVGYRRMLTPSAGIDFGLDGGLALALSQSIGGSKSVPMFGLDVSLVWGL